MVINAKPDTARAELVYSGGSDGAHTRRTTRLAEEGQLRRLYAGVYTSNLASPPEAVVLRNWAGIVGHLLPGAVLGYRSAIAGQPEDGVIYVTRGRTRRSLELPGLRIEVIPGPGALASPPLNDYPYKGIYVASEARGLLENLSQGRGLAERTLSQEQVEARLEKFLVLRGEHKLNDLRDQAKGVAGALGMAREYARLSELVGALLGTHERKSLRSRQALARTAGRPYDAERLQLFDVLFAALKPAVLEHPADKAPSGLALENFAFFEAYFSNYIEGTTFEVAEAERIVFQGAIIGDRTEDSHDVMGTFQAATREPWRNKPPASADSFLKWLQSANAQVMSARPDKAPGQWKDIANQAGNTFFVLPELVPGTLREGFERIAALEDPVARAWMTMFVVTEVHPFRDGNGRTARLAMNCALSAATLSRVIIPTVYREDYLLPLKSLSKNRDPGPYLQSLAQAQRWTAAFDYAQPRDAIRAQLERCNAFQEDLSNYRLLFPQASQPAI